MFRFALRANCCFAIKADRIWSSRSLRSRSGGIRSTVPRSFADSWRRLSRSRKRATEHSRLFLPQSSFSISCRVPISLRLTADFHLPCRSASARSISPPFPSDGRSETKRGCTIPRSNHIFSRDFCRERRTETRGR